MGDWKGNKSSVTSFRENYGAQETGCIVQNRQWKGQPCGAETVMVIRGDNLKTKSQERN